MASKFWQASSSEDESEESSVESTSSEGSTSSGAPLPWLAALLLHLPLAACWVPHLALQPTPSPLPGLPADEGSSDSDSSSSSSSSSGSSRKKGASRFLMGSSDSESEDERRVVRSAKDKAHDELRGTCNEIKVRASPRTRPGPAGDAARVLALQAADMHGPCMRLRWPPIAAAQNKMHINDWAAIQTLFDKLNKQLERTQKASAGQPACVPGRRLPQLWVGACAACACFVDRGPSSTYGCRSPRA